MSPLDVALNGMSCFLQGEGKVTFVLERLYAEGTTRYSMTRE